MMILDPATRVASIVDDTVLVRVNLLHMFLRGAPVLALIGAIIVVPVNNSKIKITIRNKNSLSRDTERKNKKKNERKEMVRDFGLSLNFLIFFLPYFSQSYPSLCLGSHVVISLFGESKASPVRFKCREEQAEPCNDNNNKFSFLCHDTICIYFLGMKIIINLKRSLMSAVMKFFLCCVPRACVSNSHGHRCMLLGRKKQQTINTIRNNACMHACIHTG